MWGFMDLDADKFSLDLLGAQLELLRFISAAVPGQDARDILQDVNVKLLSRRTEYDPTRGTVIAWAIQTAKFEVLHWRNRRQRILRLFSDEAVELLAEVAEEESVPDNRLISWCRQCYEMLPLKKRELIDAHYRDRMSLKAMAMKFGRSAGALAVALYEIRHGLHLCIAGKREQAACGD